MSALGLDTEGYVEPKLDLDWEDWHVSTRGFFAGYDGTGTARAGISLGPGPGSGINDSVRTETDLTLVRASAVYDVLSRKRDDVDLGVGAGFGWLLYDFDVRSLTGPGRVATDGDLPFAFLTVRGRVDLERFELAAEASGILWEYRSRSAPRRRVRTELDGRTVGRLAALGCRLRVQRSGLPRLERLQDVVVLGR